jgi:hypothetical protein
VFKNKVNEEIYFADCHLQSFINGLVENFCDASWETERSWKIESVIKKRLSG